MVVNGNQRFPRHARRPPVKANAPLIVDTNGMLAFAISLEGFQPVARRDTELKQVRDSMELCELAQRRALNVWR